MFNMLRVLIDKVDNMQERGNISREMEILRLKKKWKRSRHYSRIKNTFDRFVRLEMAEEKIPELNYLPIKHPK